MEGNNPVQAAAQPVQYQSTHKSRAKGAFVSILAGLVAAGAVIGAGAAISRFKPEWMTKATDLANSVQKYVTVSKEALIGGAAAVAGVVTTLIVGATAGRKIARQPAAEEIEDLEQSDTDIIVEENLEQSDTDIIVSDHDRWAEKFMVDTDENGQTPAQWVGEAVKAAKEEYPINADNQYKALMALAERVSQPYQSMLKKEAQAL